MPWVFIASCKTRPMNAVNPVTVRFCPTNHFNLEKRKLNPPPTDKFGPSWKLSIIVAKKNHNVFFFFHNSFGTLPTYPSHYRYLFKQKLVAKKRTTKTTLALVECSPATKANAEWISSCVCSRTPLYRSRPPERSPPLLISGIRRRETPPPIRRG